MNKIIIMDNNIRTTAEGLDNLTTFSAPYYLPFTESQPVEKHQKTPVNYFKASNIKMPAII